jgi:carbon storage regulator CsrA
VNAPKDVSVHREEIYQRIQREKVSGLEKALHEAKSGHQDEDEDEGNRA